MKMSDVLLIKIAPPPKYKALFLKVAFIKILACPCLTIVNTGSSCHNANCALIMQEAELIHVSDNESVIGDGDLKSAFAPNSSSGTEQPSCSASSAISSGVGLIDRLKEMFPDVENSILTSVAQVSSSLDEAVEEILGAQRAQRSAYQVDVNVQETEGKMGSYIEIQSRVRSLRTPM